MPQNIFLTDQGLKLSGFGMGLIEARRHVLDTPLLVLTAAYAAPEQMMNQPADARTDLYTLGVILYEMFTGRLPFEGNDEAVMQGPLVRPANSTQTFRSRSNT
jgi:serine/threonine-protein kinase